MTATAHTNNSNSELLVEALTTLTDAAARAAADYRRDFALGRRAGAADRQAPFVGRWIVGADVEPLTFFHSLDVPAMPLAALYRRVRNFWPKRFEDDTLGLYAVVLLLRYQAHTTLPVTSAMLHRLFMAAILVAAKVHLDDPVTNSRFAARIGLHPKELARMERALLLGIGYRGIVTEEQIAAVAVRARLAALAVGGGGGTDEKKQLADDDADFIAGDDTFVDSGRAPTPASATAPASPLLIPSAHL